MTTWILAGLFCIVETKAVCGDQRPMLVLDFLWGFICCRFELDGDDCNKQRLAFGECSLEILDMAQMGNSMKKSKLSQEQTLSCQMRLHKCNHCWAVHFEVKNVWKRRHLILWTVFAILINIGNCWHKVFSMCLMFNKSHRPCVKKKKTWAPKWLAYWEWCFSPSRSISCDVTTAEGKAVFFSLLGRINKAISVWSWSFPLGYITQRKPMWYSLSTYRTHLLSTGSN